MRARFLLITLLFVSLLGLGRAVFAEDVAPSNMPVSGVQSDTARPLQQPAPPNSDFIPERPQNVRFRDWFFEDFSDPCLPGNIWNWNGGLEGGWSKECDGDTLYVKRGGSQTRDAAHIATNETTYHNHTIFPPTENVAIEMQYQAHRPQDSNTLSFGNDAIAITPHMVPNNAADWVLWDGRYSGTGGGAKNAYLCIHFYGS